jgi:hypothetical protein
VDTVRDRLWIWGHEAGSHDRGWNLPAPSRMTPLEGACYLGVPNLIMVRYEGRPAMPFDQYARALRPLARISWSVVGGGGETSAAEREHVLELAARFPNITGFFMDDFFHPPTHPGDPGTLPLEQIRALRGDMRIRVPGRALQLGVTLYDYQLGMPVGPWLELCDLVSLWTWKAEALSNLETSFTRFEKLVPKANRLLGLYLWDYGNGRPMPLAAMERQCELGLRWLLERRIDGLIFLASCICDLGLDTVEWSRAWIARVGGQVLPGAERPCTNHEAP